MQTEIEKLRAILNKSQRLVAFTGAGVSSDSGIPTYRGAGGLWNKYDPAKYADINYFLQDPSYYWGFFKEVRYPLLVKAKPNDTHLGLVELEKQGKLTLVITQNIDGLHQVAGQKKVCELHGNTREIVCMECESRYPMEDIYPRLQQEMPPKCTCNGLLRPDVVLFGESLPQEQLQKAWAAAENCDFFLVIGSSLVVYPAAQIPLTAKQRGAFLAIINIDPTPLDNEADLVINMGAAEVVSKLIE